MSFSHFVLQFLISLSTPLLLRNFPPYKGRQTPQTTNNKHKNQKEKEFHEWIIIPHNEIATSCKQLSQWRVCEYHPLPPSSLRDFVEVVAIHKPLIVNTKIEKKKKSLLFNKPKN